MEDIHEKLEQGHIQVKAIVELLGKPKEHIEKTLKEYIEKIKKAKDLEFINVEYGDAKEQKTEDDPDLWTIFAEVEFLAKDIPTLTGFCFDYMPSSIEIIKPDILKFKDAEFTNIMNDLQGKLHSLDMYVKQLNGENKFLQRNAYFLATNLVSTLLRIKPMDLKELTNLSGLSEKDMDEFLEKLIKQNFVKKEEDKYIWIKDDKREEQD